MDPSLMIPLAALVVSLTTGIYAAIGLRQKATQHSVEINARRLDSAEANLALALRDLKECQLARIELQAKLLETMERIVAMREQILELKAELLLKQDKLEMKAELLLKQDKDVPDGTSRAFTSS